MKEFVEKLIERLEKLTSKAEQNMNYYRDLSEGDASYEVFADACEKEYKAFQKSIDTVYQLAEEHNNGFCEWEIDGVYLHSPHKELFVSCLEEEPRRYKYCPICGKQIKTAKEPSDTWKQQTMSRFERVE